MREAVILSGATTVYPADGKVLQFILPAAPKRIAAGSGIAKI
jgi:predicted TIM-barrel enzyme